MLRRKTALRNCTKNTFTSVPEALEDFEFKPLSDNQDQFLRLLADDTKNVVVATGFPGTGKTRVAVEMAVYYLRKNFTKGILMTGPISPLGKEMGFLPGTPERKTELCIGGLTETMRRVLGPTEYEERSKDHTIHICALQTVLGATFKDVWIIADESQGMEESVMKNLLTRVGFGCKLVILGDPEQNTGPDAGKDGLSIFLELAKGMSEVFLGTVRFQFKDIRRHPFVKEVLYAWRRLDAQRARIREKYAEKKTLEDENTGALSLSKLILPSRQRDTPISGMLPIFVLLKHMCAENPQTWGLHRNPLIFEDPSPFMWTATS